MSFIEKVMPDFKANAFFENKIAKYSLSEHIKRGNNLMLVFYPFDFTIVCPTEIQQISKRKNEFLENKTEVVFISRDSAFSHENWAGMEEGGIKGVSWPMISDLNGEISNFFDFIAEEEPHCERGTIILNKEGVVKHYSMNCKEIGRSVDEMLRLCKALNHVEENGEMCLVDWNN